MSTNSTVENSVHSANIDEIHEVPMNVIHRPIPPVLDENKVRSLMETIKVIHIYIFSYNMFIISININIIFLLE